MSLSTRVFKVIAFSLVFCLLFNSMAFAEGPITKALNSNPIQGQIYEVPQKRSANKVVGWLGVTTMIVGGAMMVPWPKGEDWTIPGGG